MVDKMLHKKLKIQQDEALLQTKVHSIKFSGNRDITQYVLPLDVSGFP